MAWGSRERDDNGRRTRRLTLLDGGVCFVSFFLQFFRVFFFFFAFFLEQT